MAKDKGETVTATDNEIKLTPTQQRIMLVLSDWEPHSPEELLDCLNDELCDKNALNVHITYLRARLRPHMLGVLCEQHGGAPFFRKVSFRPAVEG